MRSRFAPPTAALLLSLLAAPATAQTDTLAVEAPTVTVTAARVPMPTEAAPQRVTVLGTRAAERAGARSLADLLDARAPVAVRRYGPSGLASVSLRGASPGQTLLLLDGQRLSDPQLGQVDLGLVPTALLASAEVLHGAAGGLHGADAVGGVIGLHTPPPGAAPAARLTTEAGAWGARRASALATGPLGPVRALAAVERSAGDEDYSVSDPSILGAPRVRRLGWDRDQTSAVLSAAVGDDARGGSAMLWLADAERGLGGGLVDDALVGARQWDRRAHLGLRGVTTQRGLRVEALGAVGRARLRYASPFPAGGRADAIDDTGETQTLTAELRATRPWGRWTPTAALSVGDARAEHPSLADDARDRTLGVALSAAPRAQGGAAPDRVALFPALRADIYAPSGRDARLVVSPSLGLNVRLGRGLRAKASAGRAVRMPTLNDRFWVSGDPDLRPERALAADAGLVAAAPGRSAEVSVYGRLARDLIVWLPDGGVFTPRNVQRTRTLGLEASAQAARAVRAGHLDGVADGGLALALTSARDLGASRALRYVPAWTARAWAGLATRAAGTDLRLDLGLRASAARPVTASQRLDPYAVADLRLGAQRRLGRATLGVALVLDNLTDVRYALVQSYDMPPRAARLHLTLSL